MEKDYDKKSIESENNNSNHSLVDDNEDDGEQTMRTFKGSQLHKVDAVDFEEQEFTQSGRIQFKTTRYRWLVLAAFAGIILNLAVVIVGFSSFVKELKTAYNISNSLYIVVLIVQPMLLYVPFNFVAAWMFAHMKIHHTLLAAAIAQLVGAWIRSASVWANFNNSFWLLWLGTFLFQISNPVVLNAISVVTNLWFAENERAKATSLAGIAVTLGSISGFAITGIVAAGVESSDVQDCQERVKNLLMVQNILITFTCTAFFVIFREKPKNPPSKVSLTFRKLA